VREVAISCNDERLLAVTSGDIVAAGAHYHFSCWCYYRRLNQQGIGRQARVAGV